MQLTECPAYFPTGHCSQGVVVSSSASACPGAHCRQLVGLVPATQCPCSIWQCSHGVAGSESRSAYPAGQSVQTVEPRPELCPGAQAAQPVAGSRSWSYSPCERQCSSGQAQRGREHGQGEHTALQVWQPAEPAPAYWPTAHSVQGVAALASLSAVPGGHCVQETWPSCSAYRPGRHAIHGVPGSESMSAWPAGHREQRVKSSEMVEPASQRTCSSQLVAPVRTKIYEIV